jgi:hypothetical protein
LADWLDLLMVEYLVQRWAQKMEMQEIEMSVCWTAEKEA